MVGKEGASLSVEPKRPKKPNRYLLAVDGEWHMLAWVYNGETKCMQMFVSMGALGDSSKQAKIISQGQPKCMWSCGGAQTHSCRLNSVGLSFPFDGMQGPEAMDAVSVYDAVLSSKDLENVWIANQLKNNGYANDLPPVTPAPSATSGSGSGNPPMSSPAPSNAPDGGSNFPVPAPASAPAPAPSSVVGVLAPSTSDGTEFEMLASLFGRNEKASESFLNDIRFRENANISIAIASALRASRVAQEFTSE